MCFMCLWFASFSSLLVKGDSLVSAFPPPFNFVLSSRIVLSISVLVGYTLPVRLCSSGDLSSLRPSFSQRFFAFHIQFFSLLCLSWNIFSFGFLSMSQVYAEVHHGLESPGATVCFALLIFSMLVELRVPKGGSMVWSFRLRKGSGDLEDGIDLGLYVSREIQMDSSLIW